MNTLIIQLDSDEIRLKPQSPIESVLEALKNRETRIDPDPGLNRTDIELPRDGIDLVFICDQLSSVYLYIDPVPPRTDRFNGRCNLLSDRFLAEPGAELFCSEMTAIGLVKSDRTFPNAMDFLNEQVRVRFERRRGKSLIVFDDGSLVRGAR